MTKIEGFTAREYLNERTSEQLDENELEHVCEQLQQLAEVFVEHALANTQAQPREGAEASSTISRT